MVATWFFGVLALLARHLGGWIRVQTMRHRQTTPVPIPIFEMLRELIARLRVSRPVRLLQSRLVEVPTVIGWLRPVILLPASVLTGLSADQMQALLAHELAHVCRNDYLVNLLQTLVETLLFYHPAVWWLSRQIRQERENCCDDLAAAVCPSRIAYARALLAMEELRAEERAVGLDCPRRVALAARPPAVGVAGAAASLSRCPLVGRRAGSRGDFGRTRRMADCTGNCGR